MPLGQSSPVGAGDERKMPVTRNLPIPSEGMVDQNLPRCGIKQVIAADDVSDAHRRVVDDDRKLISRRSISFGNDKVTESGHFKYDLTANLVVIFKTLRPTAKTQGGRTAGGGLRRLDRSKAIAAGAGINRRSVLRMWSAGRRFDFLASADAWIDKAAVHKAFDCLAVNLHPQD